MTEDNIRDFFREMSDEPVPADSLRRVRIAVAERTNRGRVPWWRLAALFAAAASIALVVFSTFSTREPVARPVRVAAPAPAPPVLAREQDAPAPHSAPPAVVRVRRKNVPAVRRIERTAAPAPGVVIRIETPDPDVVILLVGD
jgi:hypothetical protein